MEISVSGQALEAAVSLFAGVLAGVVYDFLRVVRRGLRAKVVTMAADGLFWGVCAVGLFALGLAAGGGEQRIFMQVLAVLGAALYFLTLSRFVMEFGTFVLGVLGRIFHFLGAPFRWLGGIFEKFCRKLKKSFSSLRKWFTIVWRKNRPAREADITEEKSDAVKAHRYTY